MSNDEALRDHLSKLLDERQAHLTVHDVLDDFPFELIGRKPPGAPYTPWELFEHMRIAQWDILEFSRDAKHESPDHPEGYWPEGRAPTDEAEWKENLAVFKKELEALKAFVADPETDLFAKIPHGTGQTVLREAMMVADHNAYHLGQMVLLKKMMQGR